MKEIRPGYWKAELWHQGQRQAITFRGSAAEAKLYEAKKRLEIGQTGIIDPRNVPTFESFCVERYKPYAKAHRLRASTWDVRRYQITNLIDALGNLPINKILTHHVEQYTIERSREVKPGTVNSELKVLSAIFRYAAKLDIPIGKVIVEYLPDRRLKGRMKAWTTEQCQAIYAACMELAPWFFPIVFFLGQTGARKSEAVHLPWANVDMERMLIRIWSEVDSDDGEEHGAEGAAAYQVKSSEREVPISDVLLAVLKRQKAAWPDSPWVFPVHKGKHKGEQYSCFPKNTFIRVLEMAGLDGGPHKFRHTYASVFLQYKPDLYLLSKVLGHASYRTTEKLYAHMLPGYLDQARNVVPGEIPRIESTREPPRLRRVV